MEGLDADEVVAQALPAGVGEQGDAVLVALAVADGDGAEREVDVLDSETEALEDAHPGAVEEENDELDGAFDAAEEGGDLFAAEDGGQALGLAGADDVVDPGRVELEDLAVEEEDGAEGLALGGGGDVVVDGEVGEEAVDLAGVELAGVAAGEGEEAADPSEVGLLGADRVVADTDRASHPFEELRCFGASSGCRGVGDDVHGVNKP